MSLSRSSHLSKIQSKNKQLHNKYDREYSKMIIFSLSYLSGNYLFTSVGMIGPVICVKWTTDLGVSHNPSVLELRYL